MLSVKLKQKYFHIIKLWNLLQSEHVQKRDMRNSLKNECQSVFELKD